MEINSGKKQVTTYRWQMSTTIICDWQTPADFRLKKEKGNCEPFVTWKSRWEWKEGTRRQVKLQNITLCSNWQGCRHLNSWDGKTARQWASVGKEGKKFIRHTFIWPGLSLCKERNKLTDFFSHLYSKYVHAISFFLPLCYLTPLPHLRDAGQEPTPRCYSLSLHCTTPKHKGDTSVTHCFREEKMNCRFKQKRQKHEPRHQHQGNTGFNKPDGDHA